MKEILLALYIFMYGIFALFFIVAPLLIPSMTTSGQYICLGLSLMCAIIYYTLNKNL